jgi:hypothetical protein
MLFDSYYDYKHSISGKSIIAAAKPRAANHQGHTMSYIALADWQLASSTTVSFWKETVGGCYLLFGAS